MSDKIAFYAFLKDHMPWIATFLVGVVSLYIAKKYSSPKQSNPDNNQKKSDYHKNPEKVADLHEILKENWEKKQDYEKQKQWDKEIEKQLLALTKFFSKKQFEIKKEDSRHTDEFLKKFIDQEENTGRLCGEEISQAFYARGAIAEKSRHYEEALLHYEKAHACSPDTPQYIMKIAYIVDIKMNDIKKALPLRKKALEICQKKLGEKNLETATAYNNLGLVHKKMKNYEEAEHCLQAGLKIREEISGWCHQDTARSYNNLGLLYADMEDFEKARKYHETSLRIRTYILEREKLETARSYNNLGELYNRIKDYEQALPCLQKALVMRKKILGKNHSDTQNTQKKYDNALNKIKGKT